MGSCMTCSTTIQREIDCDLPIIPPITEYRSTSMQTTLKSTTCHSRVMCIDQDDNEGDEVDMLFKPHYHTLLQQQFEDSSCCSMESCESIKRIILLFQYHILVQQRYESPQSYHKLMEYLDTKYFDFINDYHHMITRHLNLNTRSSNENNREFECLYDAITKYIPSCDAAACKHFATHHGYETIDIPLHTTPGHDDHDETAITAMRFYIRLLDSVHCFVLHSFDDGFRVRMNESPQTESKYANPMSDDDELRQLFHDEEIQSLKASFERTTAPIEHILRQRMQYNKFHTNYHYRRIIECKLESISETNMETSKQYQMEQYCEFIIDHKFYYWEHYKSLSAYDNESNAGYL
eukprot:165394_1